MTRAELQAAVDAADRGLREAIQRYAAACGDQARKERGEQLRASARALVRAEDLLARGGVTDFSESRVLGLTTTVDNLNAEITRLQQQLGAKEMERARLDRELRAARIAAVQGGVKIAYFVAAIGPCDECDHPLCDLARRAQQPVDASGAVKVGAA